MQTQLAPAYQTSHDGQMAQAILRSCVHCGFCTATCPTYQLLGDELDSPRGRIYQIKQVLEGHSPGRSTQMHLDRCLTCRSCETTCPSGVQYGHLLDIGRSVVDAQVPRPLGERVLRYALRKFLPSPIFAFALRIGQGLRPLLPRSLRAKVPQRQEAGTWPTQEHARKVLLLQGCVQPALAPNINAATARVLDRLGVQTLVADQARCCGSLPLHLGDTPEALARMRQTIDAWWPWVENAAVQAILVNASGCGVTVRDYAFHLRHDAVYADKARRIADLMRDPGEYLLQLLEQRCEDRRSHDEASGLPSLFYHPPCTLQHGQKQRGQVESVLRWLGFAVELPATGSHLCCGSAGTYSITQPTLARKLRDQKLAQLRAHAGSMIVSGNIGCILHLQTGTAVPVLHWIEVVDAYVFR